MKKNVASQTIGAQMVSSTDGTAFTGTVTVYVTGDGGTQAIGGTASGVCTHEGNGFHSYTPTQAETNYAHIAFTFTGTGAIPQTLQVYTTFPQTIDNLTAAEIRSALGMAAADLDTQLDALSTGTITVSSPVAQSGNTITAKAADTWTITLASLGTLATATELFFAVKTYAADSDDDALIFISSVDGLTRVEGAAAADSSKGSITVSSPSSAGTLVVALDESITAGLAAGTYFYGLKKNVSGTWTTLVQGSFVVTGPIVEAIA